MVRATIVLPTARLDADLADGVEPTTSPAHAHRAAVLLRPRHRQTLAAGLRRAVHDADRPAVRSAAVPLDRPEILRARHALEDIATRLALPSVGIADVAAVAQVQVLLTTLESPLFDAGDVLASPGRILGHLGPDLA